ncbi:MAG: hypothetical protein JWN14_3212 [Chthonomonadales bacterium]|nr:hypothetical protein [Chthonomonadales bacterium]
MLRPEPPVGKGMPTFTRPLTPSPAHPAAASPSVLSPAMTAVSLVTLSCAALFLFVRPDGAQSLPGGKSGTAAHLKAGAAKTSTQDTDSAASSGADRQDISFYSSNVREGMFSQPVPPTPKPVEPPKPKPIKQIIVPPMPVNPFAGWTYTGTVHMGDMTMALLENNQTQEGIYVKAGDSFPNMMNAKVKSVTDQMVMLTSGPKSEVTPIAKSDTIIVTPLDRDAPGKNPQQQQQQNGQPQNGQQVNLTAQMDGSQFQMMSPNGMLSGDAATRYQNRLNRGFNRGAGGGGGGNNAGGGTGFGGGGGGGRGGGGNGGGGGRRNRGGGGFGG